MTTSEQLNKILEKTSRLIELCGALQEENDLLKLENQSLAAALDAGKTKMKEMDEKLSVLKMAKSFSETNEKSLDIKQKINEFVQEIDKCIVLMGEISIKINIADRVYPLKVNMEEEEIIRRAAKLINDRIKEYQENYAVRDKQDLLAMSVLHYATSSLKAEKKVTVEDTEVTEKVYQLDHLLSSFFSK